MHEHGLNEYSPSPSDSLPPIQRARLALEAIEDVLSRMGRHLEMAAETEVLIRFVERNPDDELSHDIVQGLELLVGPDPRTGKDLARQAGSFLGNTFNHLKQTLPPEEFERLLRNEV